MRKISILFLLLLVLGVPHAHATVFGTLHGIVHDPQHRPIAGAAILVSASHSELTFSATSNRNGEFTVPAVPLGDYSVTIDKAGFATLHQTVTVSGDTNTILHYMLSVASVTQSVNVTAIQDAANVDSVTPQTQIDRIEIAHTPGADRTNSLAMITDFVPGAYITHDMLHMRGGHQLSWLIDGVQIPNTNIASNIAPQIDPKDVDTIEVDRGSYNASLGDRTYGIFDVVPRTGFERNRDAELVLSAGNFYQTNAQLSLGNHTDRFAWYASLNGNRSNDGLQPAVSAPIHDAENGYGGFGSLIFNHDPSNQIRYVSQLRTDYYQIPYDPNPSDWENQLYDSSSLRDGQHETDSYGALTWLHTFSSNTVAQLSPFYHYNRSNYQSNPDDQPNATTAIQSGFYSGAQASVSTLVAHNTIRAGIYGYAQHENDLFSVIFNDGSANNFTVNPVVLAGVEETYIEDNFRPTDWLTLIGGIRQSHFSGAVTENAFYPRIGLALQIPKLNWVFRAFYGHFYQPPPLTSVTGPALTYAQTNNDSYVPLRGERDEEHQFGVQIPFKGWLLDADTFQTRAQNFLDHNNIGESSVFIPITVQGALIQAWELTLRSPHLWHFGQAHLSYSNQIAQQIGGITGGLVCYDPSDSGVCAVAPGYSALDHDQRNTLNLGMNANLPFHLFGAFNVYYGSGFSNGYTDPPSPYTGDYLPSHTTADLSLGRNFGERLTASVSALNVGNTRVLLDNSLTFGGFHYNDPRQLYAELRYRFKF
ncbi:MAG TPA: TonB-dependent receptor [Candidatus Aquilonibacter sp.]|nr:TonB-dependent receptor [Candidatus Aquilonibacter sp.]